MTDSPIHRLCDLLAQSVVFKNIHKNFIIRCHIYRCVVHGMHPYDGFRCALPILRGLIRRSTAGSG